MTVTIKYGDTTFYTEGDYDDVCRAIVDGRPLDVHQLFTHPGLPSIPYQHQRITFFQDVDWVAVEL